MSSYIHIPFHPISDSSHLYYFCVVLVSYRSVIPIHRLWFPRETWNSFRLTHAPTLSTNSIILLVYCVHTHMHTLFKYMEIHSPPPFCGGKKSSIMEVLIYLFFLKSPISLSYYYSPMISTQKSNWFYNTTHFHCLWSKSLT